VQRRTYRLPAQVAEDLEEREAVSAFKSRAASPALVETNNDWYSPIYMEPSRLRASDLNEVLQPDHIERLLYTNQPLQAYGALFKWDVVFDGLLELNMQAWAEIAARHSYPAPDADDVQRAMDMRAERAVERVFLWTNDWGEIRGLAFEFYELSSRLFREHTFEPSEGCVPWLKLLNEYSVPCCLCSRLDAASTDHAVQTAGVDKYFTGIVTADDGPATLEETFLLGFVKLKRPPSRCVVFENDPKGITAAHDVLAKAVAIVGKHPGYELKNAEMRIFGLDELTLMSMREVFSDMAPI